MSRSIILRFDATCFDCGASLSAGQTARWFGRGRVSCCGSDKGYPTGDRTHPQDDAAAAPFRPSTAGRAGFHSCAGLRNQLPGKPCAICGNMEHAPAPGVPLGPTPSPEALASGLSKPQVLDLAASSPSMLLLVRLTSGARLLVPARDAVHVIGCIEESLQDKCRDVARSPLNQGGGA